MNSNVSAITKKALKITGAAAMATGVVALSALVASGAAVGAVVEGFKAAGTTFKDVMKKEETQEVVAEAQVVVEETQEIGVAVEADSTNTDTSSASVEA